MDTVEHGRESDRNSEEILMMQMETWIFWGAVISAFVTGWFFARLMYKRPAPRDGGYLVKPSASFSNPDEKTKREIEKLSSLRNAGAITDNEYQSMKTKLVNEEANAPASFTFRGDWRAQVEAEIRADRKINAIKIYREATNLGLKEAKDIVDEIERNIKLGLPADFPESSPSSFGDSSLSVSDLMSDGDWRAQVEAEIRANRKINAIKLYRESTNVGLKEAKDAVEEMERSMGSNF
jgi:ribosomal protein L7/L12